MADSTRRVTAILRIRSRSASKRFALLASGHHGPSISCASSSNVRPPTPLPSARSRGTGLRSASRANEQFSPAGYSVVCTFAGGGFGPYVVHGPTRLDSERTTDGG